jgi:predicted enzyme related to lactoylglutathione lyase
MPRPVHFEFVAEDPERAARFWSEAFGWKIDKWDGPQPYWLVSTGEDGPGIDGGIVGRDSQLPGHTVVTLGVDSVDDATAGVERAGGAVVAPKMPIPSVGWLAYCRDTEGSVFGVMQSDESVGQGDAAQG